MTYDHLIDRLAAQFAAPRATVEDIVNQGECHCGCGRKTRIAKQSNTQFGHVKGEPVRFLPGHHMRDAVTLTTPHGVIDKETGCWIWGRALNHCGYGVMYDGVRQWRAHRWYYEQVYGPVPEGLTLDHLCRNRACCNPRHLEAVTVQENNRRGLNTKLTVEEVRAIRRSTLTHAALGREYGVTPGAILAVRTRKSWADVA